MIFVAPALGRHAQKRRGSRKLKLQYAEKPKRRETIETADGDLLEVIDDEDMQQSGAL